MRKIAFLVAAALAFGIAPISARLGPVPAALLLVGLAVALAVAASGTAASLAVAGGALGAFASGVLAPVSPAVAGAALASLCFAERTIRVRSKNARVLHLGVALVGGALAGSLTTAFSAASPAVRGVSVVVAAVLLALPLLVEADDPLAHALDSAAEEIGGTAGKTLREGAELRRTVDEDLLEGKATKQVRATWAALLRLADARVRLERARGVRKTAAPGAAASPTASSPAAPSHVDAVIAKVDERLAEHVSVLTRAFAAVDAAKAAEASLDDAALRGVENVGESLEQVTRAIVEDV